MRFITIGFSLLFFLCFNTFSIAQQIPLKDIYELRDKDSLVLKEFCLNNGFVLKEGKKDDIKISYVYETLDKKYRIEKTYPLNFTDSYTLYFYFNSNKELKAYRKEVLDQLFLLRGKSSTGSPEIYQTITEIYYNESDQVQLSSSYSNGASRGKAIVITKLLEVDKKRWPYIKPSTKI
ncbi:hypothetical protein [Rufibacter roseolus]|uniref:hypothetical protein n=1 Tax=Rufibacter roseolus TaxID=2817375 RepID=UPI001B3153CF|nr:hypothetical protein [Rufibacter roseolus]